jgi:hypothetical protein
MREEHPGMNVNPLKVIILPQQSGGFCRAGVQDAGKIFFKIGAYNPAMGDFSSGQTGWLLCFSSYGIPVVLFRYNRHVRGQ